MEISKKTTQQILLGTGLLLIVPMFLFPRQLGTELARVGFVNGFYELVFYAVVLSFYGEKRNLLRIVQGAGLCLLYRLGVGAVFGMMISLSYSMQLSISMQLGIASYLPAIILHVLATPLVLRPILSSLLDVSERARSGDTGHRESVPDKSGTTTLAVSRKQGVVLSSMETATVEPTREPILKQSRFEPVENHLNTQTPATGTTINDNGFERAVRYIGEHGSVYLAAVVDTEGLLLACFSRGQFDAEDLAPMAQLICDSTQGVLGRDGFSLSKLQRLDLALTKERIMIVQRDTHSLLVIAERQSDDLLNIRVNQATEMVAKYMEERFGPSETSSVENKDVSSTQ